MGEMERNVKNKWARTYGVRDMVEWTVVIHAGNCSVTVRFTGGSFNGYGTTPALFTTRNRAVQKIIEESEYFRNGRIFCVESSGNTC